MTLPSTFNLDIYYGDDLEQGFVIKDEDDNPIPFVAGQVEAYVHPPGEDEVQMNTSLVTGTPGGVTVALTAAQVKLLPKRSTWVLYSSIDDVPAVHVTGVLRVYGKVS